MTAESLIVFGCDHMSSWTYGRNICAVGISAEWFCSHSMAVKSFRCKRSIHIALMDACLHFFKFMTCTVIPICCYSRNELFSFPPKGNKRGRNITRSNMMKLFIGNVGSENDRTAMRWDVDTGGAYMLQSAWFTTNHRSRGDAKTTVDLPGEHSWVHSRLISYFSFNILLWEQGLFEKWKIAFVVEWRKERITISSGHLVIASSG